MRTLTVDVERLDDLIDYLEFQVLPLLKRGCTSGYDCSASWCVEGDDESEEAR